MSASDAAGLALSTGAIIERHLECAFSELDASTPLVDDRKQLHATLVKQAIQIAEERFPGNPALQTAIDEALDGLPPAA